MLAGPHAHKLFTKACFTPDDDAEFVINTDFGDILAGANVTHASYQNDTLFITVPRKIREAAAKHILNHVFAIAVIDVHMHDTPCPQKCSTTDAAQYGITVSTPYSAPSPLIAARDYFSAITQDTPDWLLNPITHHIFPDSFAIVDSFSDATTRILFTNPHHKTSIAKTILHTLTPIHFAHFSRF